MSDEKPMEEMIKRKAQEARKLARYMSSTQDLVELMIEKAQKRGEFDNLKGAGKPISFEENPYEPPEMRMVNKILKDNDFAPYWIELGKDIDAHLEKIKKDVEYFQRYTELFFSDKHNDAALRRFNQKKEYFYYETRLQLEKIDRKITDYNLHCPTFRVGRANLAINQEMEKIVEKIEKTIEESQRTKE
ncbi:MAG: DnaJ family domain-containing protein [Syntrophomonadaceae bacterium]|jgi:DnaJ family protein C protein 28